MKRAMGRFLAWVLPPRPAQLLRNAIGALGDRCNPILKINRQLKNRHAGERCFILATGPSINKEDLRPLKNGNCIAVSNFFVHPLYPELRPKYHCIAPFHAPIHEEQFANWLRELDQAGPDGAELFFGFSDYERIKKHRLFYGKKSYFLKFWGNDPGPLGRRIDLSMRLPAPHSVSIMAVCTAIYMGFSEIVLLGCDHDWILHVGKAIHFYDQKDHAFNKAGYRDLVGQTDFETEARAVAGLFQQYKAIRDFAQRHGVRIINASAGSLLDVFERVPLKELLA